MPLTIVKRTQSRAALWQLSTCICSHPCACRRTCCLGDSTRQSGTPPFCAPVRWRVSSGGRAQVLRLQLATCYWLHASRCSLCREPALQARTCRASSICWAWQLEGWLRICSRRQAAPVQTMWDGCQLAARRSWARGASTCQARSGAQRGRCAAAASNRPAAAALPLLPPLLLPPLPVLLLLLLPDPFPLPPLLPGPLHSCCFCCRPHRCCPPAVQARIAPHLCWGPALQAGRRRGWPWRAPRTHAPTCRCAALSAAQLPFLFFSPSLFSVAGWQHVPLPAAQLCGSG